MCEAPGIILLHTDGRVASWNEGARRIKGYAPHEIIGRSFEAFYSLEAVAIGFPKYELEVAARDRRFEDENWRLRKDGSRFWANVVDLSDSLDPKFAIQDAAAILDPATYSESMRTRR